jgi:hypothetical protein
MSEPHAFSSTGRDQAILVASRLSAAFLIFWFLFDLTLLPRQLFSVAHYLKESRVAALSVAIARGESYLLREYVLELLANILRMVVLLMAAGWFYRCGPYPQVLLSRRRITLAAPFSTQLPR